MRLSGKTNTPYIAIILILAIIFFAIVALLGFILLRGSKAIIPFSQKPSTIAEMAQTPSPRPSKTPRPEQPTASPVEPEETQTAEETQPVSQEPGSEATLDPKTEQMMDLIEEQVRQTRLLTIEARIPRKVLTPDELRAYVREDMLEDLDEEDSKEDVRHYALLGFFERDLDMPQMLEDLYSEQIAGFYEIDDHEMYVVGGEQFGINERLTYAHEYVHALQYANFDIENALGFSEDACEEDSERCIAIQALIEGDATLSQTKWFTEFATRKDIIDLLASFEDFESPVFDSVPAYLSASMMFPYEQGLAFVEHLFNTGGYDAINNAYTSTPPVSSEQIMFPERYPDDLPMKTELPDLLSVLGEAWESDAEGVVGAADSYFMLTKGLDESYRLDPQEALTAIEGWGGDAYAFLSSKSQDEYLFVMKTVWDTHKDSQEAWDAFVKMLGLRFGEPNQDGLYSAKDTFARIFKTGDNGFILIISEGLESLNTVYDELAK